MAVSLSVTATASLAPAQNVRAQPELRPTVTATLST